MSYYSQSAEIFFTETKDLDLSFLYAPFLELLPPGATIIDAGCGSGRDIKAFQSLGYKVSGFDRCSELVELALVHTQGEVRCCSFSEFSYEAPVDGIWACASLLHVEKKHMLSTLNHLSKLLKEKGILYMSFKEGSGERWVGKRWFNFYTEETLTELLNEIASLKIEHIWKSSDIREEQSQIWINCLARKESYCD